MKPSDKKKPPARPEIHIVPPKAKKSSNTSKVVITPAARVAATTPKVRRTDAEWLLLIDEFETSGLKGTVFCSKKKIDRSTFYRKREQMAEKYKKRKPGEIPPSAY